MLHPKPSQSPSDGFTLVEFFIVIAIMALVAGMAIPAYQAIINGASVQTATSDLEMIAKAIDMHAAQTGSYPESLDEVGYGELLDPWGQPYQYLPLEGEEDPELVVLNDEGTKILSELADLGADESSGPGKSGGKGKGKKKGHGKKSDGGAEAAAAQPTFSLKNGKTIRGHAYGHFKKHAEAAEDIEGEININSLIDPNSPVPLTEEFVYFARKTASLRPLNTDYDLFTMGPDCDSAPAIDAPASEDDILRADNGDFIGPVTMFGL